MENVGITAQVFLKWFEPFGRVKIILPEILTLFIRANTLKIKDINKAKIIKIKIQIISMIQVLKSINLILRNKELIIHTARR